MTRYTKAKNGEWINPVMKGYRMMCCDCSLVHRIDFKVVDGVVKFRAFRMVRETAAQRKKKS